MNKQNSILVIGKPNSGKSGFFGQLYARLDQQDENSFAQLIKTPENIAAINQILERYADGKSLEHTPVNEFENLDLDIEINGQQFTLRYPDYGGEQVNALMNTRRLDDRWYQHIQNSNSWFLFIRVGSLSSLYDPINKFAEIVKSDNRNEIPVEKTPSDQAFYIELIQMLLYYKGIGYTQKNNSPHISIVLSCWDEIENLDENQIPEKLLKRELPLLYEFLIQNWNKTSLNVIGLSSQGRKLDKDKSDEDFLYEEEGYLILPNGEKTKDLTSLLNTAII